MTRGALCDMPASRAANAGHKIIIYQHKRTFAALVALSRQPVHV